MNYKAVTTKELIKIFLILVKNLERRKGKKIYIKENFYWSILDNDLYNLSNKPKNVSVGSHNDEVEWLMMLIKSSDRATSCHLKWFSSLLRLISTLYM